MESLTILVVEDELSVASGIKETLEKRGYLVPAIAASGEDAIQKAGDLQPDLVLMDIELGAPMDSVEAADCIRRDHDIPVVFLAANSDEESLERAKRCQAFGSLINPSRKKD